VVLVNFADRDAVWPTDLSGADILVSSDPARHAVTDHLGPDEAIVLSIP